MKLASLDFNAGGAGSDLSAGMTEPSFRRPAITGAFREGPRGFTHKDECNDNSEACPGQPWRR